MTAIKTGREFTQVEATEEALLLFIRKMRRLHGEEFADVWNRLPEGAREALMNAEVRADVRRDTMTGTWPALPDLDAGTE